LQKRNAPAGTYYTVQGDQVIVPGLNTGLEHLGFATENRRRARLVLRYHDRTNLRPVHAREGDEIAARVHGGNVELPATFLGLGHGSVDGGLGLIERYRCTVGDVGRHLVRHDVQGVRLRRNSRGRLLRKSA